MKKLVFLIVAAVFLSHSAISQSSSETPKVEGTEFLPVGGHSETGVPRELQGIWVLKSKLQPGKNELTLQDGKKSAPGSERRRDSITTTKTINGVTHTTTEVEVERTLVPEKQVTPPQGSKMHRPESPSISFFGLNQTFSGFTGCNKYSGRYNINGSRITFRDAAASTKMVCIGEANEGAFLDALKNVNAYKTSNGQLELMNGDDVLLVFQKK